ncbi:MAG: glycosyltransferase, partial [Gammaproteobacteria bacterium]|nr:glycosyltransferase [Gammaproteobacteria bacterium]
MGIEEAMAAGVPVVTSNMCGMPYMVSYDESGYLVNPSEITDISDKIKRLLDIDRNKDFSEKSKEIARERFHPDVVTRKTLNLYRELLS